MRWWCDVSANILNTAGDKKPGQVIWVLRLPHSPRENKLAARAFICLEICEGYVEMTCLIAVWIFIYISTLCVHSLSFLLFSKLLKLGFHIHVHGWPFIWNATLVLCSVACPLWTETNVMLDPHTDPLPATAINSTCLTLLCPLWSTYMMHRCSYTVHRFCLLSCCFRCYGDGFGIRKCRYYCYMWNTKSPIATRTKILIILTNPLVIFKLLRFQTMLLNHRKWNHFEAETVSDRSNRLSY